MELREVLQRALKESNKTVYRVCKDGDVNTATLYNYIQGKKHDIKLESLKKLANGIGVPLWEIIKEWEESN